MVIGKHGGGTMVGSRRGKNERVDSEFERQVWAYREAKTGLDGEDSKHDGKSAEYYEVDFRITLMASMRRFCLTGSGRIGCVPQAAEVGLMISIVATCDLPIVLRPNGDSYLVIGPCYIHEVMDGEALGTEGIKFEPIQLI
ncbi:hypothetical protein MMC18_001828 [Xylographa bjoerkii]|nr:hypothetical protein [Xylographa bjoerkii]